MSKMSATSLTFTALDPARFPALGLARDALAAGPAHLIALNAANEVAVEQFLQRTVPYTAIAACVTHIVEQTATIEITSIADVLMADSDARKRSEEFLACRR